MADKGAESKNITPKPDLGFHFTDKEEKMIKRAGLFSRVFMTYYGKGCAPIEINKQNYFGGVDSDVEPAVEKTNNKKKKSKRK